MSRRVGLVVGDTPGHFFPALAVRREYEQRHAGAHVMFFGPRGGRAAALASEHACEYHAVSSSQIARVGPIGLAAAAARTSAGVFEARGVLARREIEIVIGFGGFASGAVLLAARSLGCRTAIHEANVVPGLANRWLSRVVDRVYVSEWTERTRLPARRVVVTGWPVRSIDDAMSAPRDVQADREWRLLVCSGSRGGTFFSDAVPPLAARLAAAGQRVEVRHQSGDVDARIVEERYRSAGIRADVTTFVGDMAAAYRWADVAIARAGAGTIAELALAGLPSVLVPLPDAANNHQEPNARAYAAVGAGVCVTERAWEEERVAGQLTMLMSPVAWRAASASAGRHASPDAARDVVNACEALMEHGR